MNSLTPLKNYLMLHPARVEGLGKHIYTYEYNRSPKIFFRFVCYFMQITQCL